MPGVGTLRTGKVTSYTEVWIEINDFDVTANIPMSLPTRKCGLKYVIMRSNGKTVSRHFLHGSVD